MAMVPSTESDKTLPMKVHQTSVQYEMGNIIGIVNLLKFKTQLYAAVFPHKPLPADRFLSSDLFPPYVQHLWCNLFLSCIQLLKGGLEWWGAE